MSLKIGKINTNFNWIVSQFRPTKNPIWRSKISDCLVQESSNRITASIQTLTEEVRCAVFGKRVLEYRDMFVRIALSANSG